MATAPHGTHNKQILLRNESIANQCKDDQIAMIANEGNVSGLVAPLPQPHQNLKNN